MAPREPLAQRIDHIGIVVHDADAAAAYYRDTFGLQPGADVVLPDGSARLVYLEAGDTTLQLVQPLRAGPAADHLAARGEGLHHVCFAVSDLRHALASLPNEPDAVVSPGGRGLHVSFIGARPNGVTIELTGPTTEAVPGDETPAAPEVAWDSGHPG
ncbi:MAG: VOC family protein [Chloroflexi bacterium]|nr:VOC family protein [Chloroflexota bacterium]